MGKTGFQFILKLLQRPQKSPYGTVLVQCLFGACMVHWGLSNEFWYGVIVLQCIASPPHHHHHHHQQQQQQQQQQQWPQQKRKKEKSTTN